jgi:hypothetical protein
MARLTLLALAVFVGIAVFAQAQSDLPELGEYARVSLKSF